MSLTLREIVDADLPILFEQQLDPEANWMAAFTAVVANWVLMVAADRIDAPYPEAVSKMPPALTTFWSAELLIVISDGSSSQFPPLPCGARVSTRPMPFTSR